MLSHERKAKLQKLVFVGSANGESNTCQTDHLRVMREQTFSAMSLLLVTSAVMHRRKLATTQARLTEGVLKKNRQRALNPRRHNHKWQQQFLGDCDLFGCS